LKRQQAVDFSRGLVFGSNQSDGFPRGPESRLLCHFGRLVFSLRLNSMVAEPRHEHPQGFTMTYRALLLFFVALAITASRARGAEDLFFDSNGVRIHYTDEGQGEPVLLIHGFTADIEMNWSVPGIDKGLAKEYRVLAIDNRGHGKSDKPHDA